MGIDSQLTSPPPELPAHSLAFWKAIVGIYETRRSNDTSKRVITQAEIGKAAGVNQSQVNRWINDKRVPESAEEVRKRVESLLSSEKIRRHKDWLVALNEVLVLLPAKPASEGSTTPSRERRSRRAKSDAQGGLSSDPTPESSGFLPASRFIEKRPGWVDGLAPADYAPGGSVYVDEESLSEALEALQRTWVTVLHASDYGKTTFALALAARSRRADSIWYLNSMTRGPAQQAETDWINVLDARQGDLFIFDDAHTYADELHRAYLRSNRTSGVLVLGRPFSRSADLSLGALSPLEEVGGHRLRLDRKKIAAGILRHTGRNSQSPSAHIGSLLALRLVIATGTRPEELRERLVRSYLVERCLAEALPLLALWSLELEFSRETSTALGGDRCPSLIEPGLDATLRMSFEPKFAGMLLDIACERKIGTAGKQRRELVLEAMTAHARSRPGNLVRVLESADPDLRSVFLAQIVSELGAEGVARLAVRDGHSLCRFVLLLVAAIPQEFSRVLRRVHELEPDALSAAIAETPRGGIALRVLATYVPEVARAVLCTLRLETLLPSSPWTPASFVGLIRAIDLLEVSEPSIRDLVLAAPTRMLVAPPRKNERAWQRLAEQVALRLEEEFSACAERLYRNSHNLWHMLRCWVNLARAGLQAPDLSSLSDAAINRVIRDLESARPVWRTFSEVLDALPRSAQRRIVRAVDWRRLIHLLGAPDNATCAIRLAHASAAQRREFAALCGVNVGSVDTLKRIGKLLRGAELAAFVAAASTSERLVSHLNTSEKAWVDLCTIGRPFTPHHLRLLGARLDFSHVSTRITTHTRLALLAQGSGSLFAPNRAEVERIVAESASLALPGLQFDCARPVAACAASNQPELARRLLSPDYLSKLAETLDPGDVAVPLVQMMRSWLGRPRLRAFLESIPISALNPDRCKRPYAVLALMCDLGLTDRATSVYSALFSSADGPWRPESTSIQARRLRSSLVVEGESVAQRHLRRLRLPSPGKLVEDVLGTVAEADLQFVIAAIRPLDTDYAMALTSNVVRLGVVKRWRREPELQQLALAWQILQFQDRADMGTACLLEDCVREAKGPSTKAIACGLSAAVGLQIDAPAPRASDYRRVLHDRYFFSRPDPWKTLMLLRGLMAMRLSTEIAREIRRDVFRHMVEAYSVWEPCMTRLEQGLVEDVLSSPWCSKA